MKKPCSLCGSDKNPMPAFGRRCRVCLRRIAQAYYRRPEVRSRALAREKAYRKDPAKRAEKNARQKVWAKSERGVELRRDNYYKRSFGISLKEYKTLEKAQHGRCAICRGLPKERKLVRRLHVDHCHKTGRIRGLLCHHCNTAIGQLGDSPSRLQRAMAYLAKED